MRAAGFTPDSVTIAGGATRSELWLQIHADVSNVPFILTKARQGWRGCTRVAGSPGAAWRAEAIKAKVGLYLPSNAPLYLNLVAWVAALSAYSGPLASREQVADAPALGCAILAAVAAGLFPDVPAACAAMVHQVGVASKGAGRGAHTHGLQYVNAEIPYTPRPLQCLPSVSDAAINFSLLTPHVTPSNTLMPLHHGSAGPGCAARPAAACRVPAALPGLHGAVPSPQAWVPRGSKPAAAAAGRCGATCSSSQWQPAGGRWSCRGAAFDRLPLHPVCRLCQPGAGRGPRGEGGCVWSGAGVPCAEGAHHTQAGPMLCRGGCSSPCRHGSTLMPSSGKWAAPLALPWCAGAEWVHVDIFDGVFVPNLTIGEGWHALLCLSWAQIWRSPTLLHLYRVRKPAYMRLSAGATSMCVQSTGSSCRTAACRLQRVICPPARLPQARRWSSRCTRRCPRPSWTATCAPCTRRTM